MRVLLLIVRVAVSEVILQSARCIAKDFDFCFECPEFQCETNWGEKVSIPTSYSWQEKASSGNEKDCVEEWVGKQWE